MYSETVIYMWHISAH